MPERQQRTQTARCTLCPAGCRLGLVQTGPDNWRVEYPSADGEGLCPRGSTLGELLGHRRRILAPARQSGGQLCQIDFPSAVQAVLDAAAGKSLTILLDGNVPCEQMAAAAAWCAAWDAAKLCFFIEPADEQLLLGTEASGAAYLAGGSLAECDGFVMIGDAFGANPICSRGVFDRRKAEPRTPIVVIGPAAGATGKFASHRVCTEPGLELAALCAVASAAGVAVEGVQVADVPAAAAAGAAIAGCRRLAVIIAAEHGRSAAWRQIGYAGGRLAKARGGGVAPQTAGANALAAVRLGARLGAMPLAKALAPDGGVRVVIGPDALGMLGWREMAVAAAAAAIPNRTTESAEIVFPVAMTGELGGTVLLEGEQAAVVAPLMKPPAGIPTPAELIASLARAAGVSRPDTPGGPGNLERLQADRPAAAPPREAPPAPVLVLGRQATHAGCGALTGCGSWQAGLQSIPELQLAADDAAGMSLNNLDVVSVSVNGQSAQGRVRIAPELAAGTMVLAEGFPQARSLLPYEFDSERDAVVAVPATASVSR